MLISIIRQTSLLKSRPGSDSQRQGMDHTLQFQNCRHCPKKRVWAKAEASRRSIQLRSGSTVLSMDLSSSLTTIDQWFRMESWDCQTSRAIVARETLRSQTRQVQLKTPWWHRIRSLGNQLRLNHIQGCDSSKSLLNIKIHWLKREQSIHLSAFQRKESRRKSNRILESMRRSTATTQSRLRCVHGELMQGPKVTIRWICSTPRKISEQLRRRSVVMRAKARPEARINARISHRSSNAIKMSVKRRVPSCLGQRQLTLKQPRKSVWTLASTEASTKTREVSTNLTKRIHLVVQHQSRLRRHLSSSEIASIDLSVAYHSMSLQTWTLMRSIRPCPRTGTKTRSCLSRSASKYWMLARKRQAWTKFHRMIKSRLVSRDLTCSSRDCSKMHQSRIDVSQATSFKMKRLSSRTIWKSSRVSFNLAMMWRALERRQVLTSHLFNMATSSSFLISQRALHHFQAHLFRFRGKLLRQPQSLRISLRTRMSASKLMTSVKNPKFWLQRSPIVSETCFRPRPSSQSWQWISHLQQDLKSLSSREARRMVWIANYHNTNSTSQLRISPHIVVARTPTQTLVHQSLSLWLMWEQRRQTITGSAHL